MTGETGRRGDGVTGRYGTFTASPRLRVTPSPCLPVSVSPRLPVCLTEDLDDVFHDVVDRGEHLRTALDRYANHHHERERYPG